MTTHKRKPTQPSKSSQAEKTSKRPAQGVRPIEPGPAPDATQPHLVRIHDLATVALLAIPPELRTLIGEEAYERQLEDLQKFEVLLIVREPHDVVYIRAPLYTMPLKRPYAAPAATDEARATPAAPGKAKSRAPGRKPARQSRGQG